MTQTTPPASPFALADVSEAEIRTLVHEFYAAVQKDPVIGPVFARQIAPDAWPVHLARMCDFWSSVLLKTSRYDGRPLPPHLRLPDLSDTHFARWLALFRATARGTLPPEEAPKVIALAERIAYSFRLSVAFHRGEDSTKVTPLPASA